MADIYFEIDTQGNDLEIKGKAKDTSFKGIIKEKAVYKLFSLAAKAFMYYLNKNNTLAINGAEEKEIIESIEKNILN